MTKRDIFSELVEGFDALKSDGDVAGCLASSVRKPLSEAKMQALIKARLKAEDSATMPRTPKSAKKVP